MAAMGIVEFATARLNETENRARLVLSDYGGHQAEWQVPSTGVLVVGEELYALGDGPLAEHIARHDPARVLREVAAKRERLRMYIQQQEMLKRIYADPDMFTLDQQVAAATSAGVLEAVIRQDAAVDAGHPDFNPAWRVA